MACAAFAEIAGLKLTKCFPLRVIDPRARDDSASVLSPSWLLPLVASPFASVSQIPTFRLTASLASSGHLSCRMPLRP
jgi:hypothetical protein